MVDLEKELLIDYIKERVASATAPPNTKDTFIKEFKTATDSRTTLPALQGWFNKYMDSVEKDEHLTNDDLAKHLWILKMQAKTELLKRLQKTGETNVIGNRTNRKLIGFRSHNRSLVIGILKVPSTAESDELVSDEFRFVADLKEVIIHYLEPFEAVENQNSLPEALRGKPDCLFGNIRKLCEFHDRVVLKDLVAARSTLDMCRVLMQHRNQIYITYRTYCQIHGSNQEIRDSVKNHPFFNECQKKANHNMDISSYLLKPIQRIMKYQLLLANIMDDCPADVRDEVAMTRDSMVELLNQIDASMQQLHISGYNGDLKSLGLLRLQTECDVYTYNRKKKAKLSPVQKRFLFFFDGAVMFCKKRVSNPEAGLNSEPDFEHKLCIPIISLGHEAASRTGAGRFEVWDEAKTDAYVIETIDPSARTKWIQRLGKSDTSQDTWLENRQRPKSWASTVSNESSFSSSTRESDSADSTMDTNGNTQTTQVNVPYSPTLDGHLDLTFGDEVETEGEEKTDEKVETEGEEMTDEDEAFDEEEEEEKEEKEEDEVHVKKEIRSDDEEEASLTGLLMNYSRAQLLNGLQRVASVMNLPIPPKKLNQNIVLKYHIFKTSEISDMFHNLIATWIEKKHDYTNDGNLLDLAFKRLHCTISYECFDDISEVRGALKDAIEKTKGTGQCVSISTISESMEAFIDLLLADTQLVCDL